MSKNRRDMDDWERETMILGIQSMRDPSPIEYVAPGPEQKWRARDLLDIHWELVGIPTPSPSYNRIMSCIIGHANPTTGRCQLKQKLIAVETGYCVKTVRRVIDWWVAHGFLIEQDMGLAKSRAYHPQWDLFEMHWIAINEDIKARKESWRGNSMEPPMDIKGSIAMDTTLSNMNLKEESQRLNLIQNGRVHLRGPTPVLLLT